MKRDYKNPSIMSTFRSLCCFLLALGLTTAAQAHINPKLARERQEVSNQNATINFRENCDNSTSQYDMSLNNVRARLLGGGDVWWDGNNGRYIVPKVPPGQEEVSSIFAGAVWLGGVDPAGNLKVAAQQYGRSSGDFDYWPGPLDPDDGQTEQEICAKWDKFFPVFGEEIDEHLRNFEQAKAEGRPYQPEDIPINVRGWPARGNEFFFDIHQFELPNTSQGLAGFYDQDGDGLYNPDLGDYPVIEVRGCEAPQYPDEMVFWIYNDNGNIHAQSMADPIQMEVQVQAFSYATNDEINDMTFQRYKLINRAIESIDSTFFAMWVDPDLGCFSDDYVGSDTSRNLAYVYNEDALDGQSGCVCDQGIATYCDRVPILGVDYFRGPLNENFEEIGMSSFTYYNNGGVGSPPPGTTDPNNAQEYYNYLSGSWRDGSPFTFGDDAYQDGDPVSYAFTDPPDDTDGWSMCTEALPFGDRRTIQASGPFRLDPGAVNELIIGVVWVADQDYPCPSIRTLQEADDIAQALFDNCFEITDGPDAPDVDFVELDREVIAVFTNDSITSNNAFEGYAQRGLQIPAGEPDSLYRFEGYKLYQLAGPNVTLADLNNPDEARLIYQVDLKNNIEKIFNWQSIESPLDEEFFTPVLQVDGQNQGIRHTFRISSDAFASDDPRLINHKKYYFTAIAYAHNEYEEYDPDDKVGQRRPYLEGRRNIGDGTNPFYTVIPRPIVDRSLNAEFGDGAIVTRIDGIGAGGNFLDLSQESREAVISGDFNGELVYRPGRGPIDVKVFNPLDVIDGEFELTFVDEDMSNGDLDDNVRWELRNLSDPTAPVIFADRSIERLNEQIIRDYGFSLAIAQTDDVGDRADDSNGAIGYEEEYINPDAEPWFSGVPEGFSAGITFLDEFIFDYVATGPAEEDVNIDPTQALTNIGPGYFVPYYLCNWRVRADQPLIPYITPAWTDLSGSNVVRIRTRLQSAQNIDVVLTSDKSKWSRCVVIETANRYYEESGFFAEGERKHFDLRDHPNVTENDNDGDGLPDIDQEDPGKGMGWFPGYAINVETGQRLNIFFGENSTYNGDFFPESYQNGPIGNDMMFNPSSQLLLNTGGNINIYSYLAGGQHFMYVTNQPYDGCQELRQLLQPTPVPLRKVSAIQDITWAALPLLLPGQEMRSYQEGLIPEDVILKVRVDNPYQVAKGTGAFEGYPTYRFKLENKQASELTPSEVETALDMINVAPNPYFGFSEYETSQFTNTVKITNLPAKATITIYSLDGKFIRLYERDETGITPEGVNRAVNQQQILPDLEWDLRNNKGIPIGSGVYLIHVAAEGMGERTIKWFGVNRKFDPSGL